MLRENVQTIGGKLSMNTVKVRNVEIGSGVPKICVPIVGVTKDEIIAEAKTFDSIPVDVVEWRVAKYKKVILKRRFHGTTLYRSSTIQ